MTDIIVTIEKRLAEIEAEASKLRAMLAAAKGESPAPAVQPPVFVPYPVPGLQPPTIDPWKPYLPWYEPITITGTGTGVYITPADSVTGTGTTIS